MQNIEKYKKEVFERLKHCEKLDQSDMDTLFRELGEALFRSGKYRRRKNCFWSNILATHRIEGETYGKMA